MTQPTGELPPEAPPALDEFRTINELTGHLICLAVAGHSSEAQSYLPQLGPGDRQIVVELVRRAIARQAQLLETMTAPPAFVVEPQVVAEGCCAAGRSSCPQ